MTITNDTTRLVSDGVGEQRAAELGLRPMTTAGSPSQELLGFRRFATAVTGEPLRELPETSSVKGVLDHTVQVAEADDTGHPGVSGALLRVHAGDRLRLKLAGPRSRQHTTDIPADHPAGLHWHPSHLLGTPAHGAPVSPMVVAGEVDEIPGIAGARERIMVMDGFRPDGTLLGFTVNGQLQPEIGTQPGEIQRWRVANAEPRQAMWLHVEGHTLHQIGQDGIPFGRVRPVQSIFLAPGNRAEFLVRANKSGQYRVYAQSLRAGRAGGPRPITELAIMAVSGRSIFSRLPRQLVDSPAIPAEPVVNSRALHVRADTARPGRTAARFHLEGRELSPGRIGPEAGAGTGTVEEWTLINDDAFQNLIHVDGHPFQVVGVNGVPAGDPSWQTDPDIWWDTYRLPPSGQLTIRVYFRGAPPRR